MESEFHCLIPDKPLTRYEQFAVGVTTMGAFRGNFREATVSLKDNQMIISAKTDVVAGGKEVTIADIPIHDIAEIHCASIGVSTQRRLALFRSLIIGGGIGLVIFFGVMAKVGTADIGGLVSTVLPFTLICGLAMGFLFSFLPNLSKAKKNLFEVQFVFENDKVLPVALTPEQIKIAKSILESRGFRLIETDTNIPHESNQDIADAYYKRGDAYYEEGEYEKAIADYNKAAELDPNHADAYYSRGCAYAEEGEYEKAIADYNKAIELDSNHADVYYSRGCVYAEKREHEKAIADYNKAIELDPNHTDAYYDRGLAHNQMSEFAKAVNDLEKCIGLSNDAELTKDARQALSEVKNSLGKGESKRR
jgi:lipoprotein NlpI